MSLLSPLLLLGLLGLGLPVIAHLLGRERPQTIRFAALRFVRPQEPIITQRRSIRDWPLLLLRMLLLAAAVLVLARPVIGSDAPVTVLAEPHDAVILLDASASMDLLVDGRSDRERAREQIELLLEALPVGSRVGLVISDPRAPQLDPGESSGAVDRIRAQLDGWIESKESGPRPGAWSLAEALPRASAMLSEREGDRPRVIYAVGDPTGAGLGSLPASTGEGITVIPIPTRGRPGEPSPPAPEHVGLSEVGWEPAPELDPKALRIHATVHRWGGSGDELLEVGVALLIGDEEVARTRTELRPDGDAEVEFVHVPSASEALRARVELLDRADDPLPFDDRRHLWLAASDALEVLLVDGDPSETRANDEIFFLSTALGQSGLGTKLEIRGLSPDQLEQRLGPGEGREGAEQAPVDPLAGVDLLVLANVRAPSEQVAARIRERVEQGMGLWISVGDRVSPSEYNERFSRLLPLLLREAVYTGTAPGRTEARSESLAPVAAAHPIFTGLGGASIDLAATQTKRMFLLEPDPRRQADIALAFTSGAPALITTEVGRGRVALLTTTIDRDWTDLPLRPGFVPLVTRTGVWLAGANEVSGGSRIAVGASKQLGRAVPYSVSTPSGEALPASPEHAGEPTHFERSDWPGHYRASPIGEPEAEEERFVVEVDPRESDTSVISLGAQASAAELGGAGSVTIYRPRWRELALIVLVLLGIESVARWRLSRAS